MYPDDAAQINTTTEDGDDFNPSCLVTIPPRMRSCEVPMSYITTHLCLDVSFLKVMSPLIRQWLCFGRPSRPTHYLPPLLSRTSLPKALPFAPPHLTRYSNRGSQRFAPLCSRHQTPCEDFGVITIQVQ
ncbi:hypothetical protein CPB85DRAFT_608641 [Mucidula mucida]|nr:hypothetical protein CPB85DRAFT_608641 [Mucidula mucida]